MKEKAVRWFILIFPCVFGWGFGYMACHEAGIQDSRTPSTLSMTLPSQSPVTDLSSQNTLLECLCPGNLSRFLELPWVLKNTLENPGFLRFMDLNDYGSLSLSASRPREALAGNMGSSNPRMLLLHPSLHVASAWQLRGRP